MKIKVNGGQFFADGFPIRKGFELREGKETAISCLSAKGVGYALLRAVGQEVQMREEGGIELVRWRQGAELRPATRSERTVCRRTFSEGGFFLQVALFTGDRSRLVIAGAASYAREIPFPLRAPCIEIITGQKEKILEVRASAEGGEYLSFLSVETSGVTLLLEEIGEKILCAGNEVTVTKTFLDLRGRKRVTRYLWRGDRFDCSREYLCANAHPFIREESGRLFLEAMLAGDEQDAISFLSPDLADYAALKEYFGEMIAVRDPLFPETPSAVAAEYGEAGYTRAILYDFDFDPHGRITNIRRLDDDPS